MASQIPIHPNAETVLLFGSQALSFDEKSFHQLSSTVTSSLSHSWVLRAIDDLPELWETICERLPKLRAATGAARLPELADWFRAGTMSVHPLPNVLLSPLVVISQLTQYTTFSEMQDHDSLNLSETVGFCIGLLSAFAVSSSSRKAEFERYAAAAVRIALLVGAVVDVQNAQDESGESTTVTVAWKQPGAEDVLSNILTSYPDAYVSVTYDENRASITSSLQSATALQKDLVASGFTVAEIGLSGRFHSEKHSSDFHDLINFCASNFDFALPDAAALKIPTRSNFSGDYITRGSLHEVALQAILLDQSRWYKTFSEVKTSRLANKDSRVICFGPERCIPPTLLRGISTQVLYAEDFAPALRSGNDIAVVGMSINVAGANDVDEFWQLLASGKSQHKPVPQDRFGFNTVFREKDASRAWFGNFIDHHDTFDHKFFKKTPRESASMDPQQRLLLQAAYQAVEQSGYFHDDDVDKHVGCYVGLCGTDYAEGNVACHPANAFTATGTLRGFIAGKVSHYFGWTGPGVTIDTACSGSAVAIHQACSAILSGECTTALAGGTNIMTQPIIFQNLAGASFLSTTGQCKPFDFLADGYCRGEAIAAVFLKKMSAALKDGDQILGVISGTAVHQNQNCTPIVVPNAPSLSDLFRNVLRKSALWPDQVSVVEAHGTGTPVGDPAEYESIRRVFGGFPRSKALQLGSVKGLVGHTEGTSGAVSLIKVLLMMQKGLIPPQASFSKMNPAINATPADNIQVSMRLQPWETEFKAALINNYGASGSNASMVVTQGPRPSIDLAKASPVGIKYPFWLCGLDERSIRAYATRLRRYLKTTTASIADLSFNLARQSNRTFEKALIFSCRSVAELDEKLAAFQNEQATTSVSLQPTRPVILCFGGQISTSVGLDRQVYDNVAILRNHLDRCDVMARKLGVVSIYPTVFQKDPIEDIVELQVALFALQYSTAKSWIQCGARPAALVGHSFGELTALCVSGVLSMHDAMSIIIGRAKIIRDSWGAEKGSMLAVEADVHEVNRLLADSGTPATIACFNGPRSQTVAGSVHTIDVVVQTINARYPSLRFKRLNVSNAFHSTLVQSLMPELSKLGEGLTFNSATIPIERATEERDLSSTLSADFAATHLRNPVYFNHALQRLAKRYPSAVWLEAGSNATVTSMASKALGTPKGNHFQAINISSTQSLQRLIDTTLSLWEAGVRVAYWGHAKVQTYEYTTLSIPPYQFDRPKHWLELKEPPKLAAALASHVAQAEGSVPTSLWTFTGYQDSKQQLARFRFNTMIPQYEEIVAGHTIAGTAPICPATVQIDVAIEAVRSLHSDLRATSILPQIRSVVNLVPLCVDPSRSVWLDIEAVDSIRRTWSWKMISTGLAGAASTTHVTGEILFRSDDDLQYHLEFARYERLVSHRRCLQVLHSEDADEVIQGRSIYRIFSDVVDYGKQYYGLQKLVGNGNESAGLVVKKHSGETWLDAFLSDAFCQTGGIWVNCMTDRDPSEMYIANGIEQWVRSPKLSRDGAPQTEKWHVFGSHSRSADGNSFLSDLFVFDAKTERLTEVILGIHYAKVSRSSMGKLLARLTAPGTGGTTAFEPVPAPVATAIVQEPRKKRSSDDSSGLIKKLKLILADISGLEIDEIKDDVQLGDIGVDSLMGMEMAREIETAFKCALPQDELMLVTDIPGLLKCLKSALGTDGAESSDGATLDSSDESDYDTQESVSNSSLPSTPDEDHAKEPVLDLELSHSTILEAFEESKLLTDKLIEEYNAQDYLRTVIPKQDQFCVALTIEAFRELGCDLATAAPGEELPQIPHAPDQEKFTQYLYRMLEETRIVDLDDGCVMRTHVAVPAKSSSDLLAELNKKYPDHTCSNELAQWTGSHLAGILTGKEDGIKLIFGTEKGRKLVSGVYADFPLNKLYYKQMGDFLSNLLSKVSQRPGQGPLKILEMGAGTGGTTKVLVPLLASLGVPVEYTFTDLAPSFVAAARKQYKQYPFMKYRVHDIEKPPADDLAHSQHVVIASNAIHATRSLPGSTENIRRMLRPDGLLMMLEMTQPMFWCDIIFGVFEGWWLFEDGRNHAVASPERWEKDLHSVGYGHVDWSDGHSPEVALERVIIATASGPQLDRLPVAPAPPQISTWNHDARRDAVNEYVKQATEGFAIPVRSNTSTDLPNNSLLITGATGSLGAHMVAHYARLSYVDAVFCLNRRSGSDALQRQRQSLLSKGIFLDEHALSKLKVYEVDTSKPQLGLSPHDYEVLASAVTHIVHNAWPMNAKQPLKAFKQQFTVLRNLLDLSADISSRRPSSKVSFQLISSIATVGHYPLHTGNPHIPEERMTIESVLPNGYGDAKFTCELMLDATLHRHPSRFRAMAVRLGQVAGSSTSGYWNTMEHLSFLVKSSQTLRSLPDLDGPLSWTPVDDVAAACADLALAENVPHPIYHIDNPVRQPWKEMLPTLAEALDIPRERVVAFEEWIRRVRAFPGGETENPAVRLVDFLEEDFRRMSCGGVLLETKKSREHSLTMRGVGPVGEETVRKYVGAWKETGFLVG